MRFQELFLGYTRAHGRYRVSGSSNERGKVEGRAFTRQGSPTDEDWQRHLTAKGEGLGMIPLCDDNATVCFGAIDIDIYPLDHAALEHDCAELPLVMTKSKSGGAHLWLFLKEPTSAKLVIAKLQEWAAALGYGGAEVFPKQHSRTASDDIGNWINLPYYGNTRRCFYEGKEVDLETFLTVAESRRITERVLRKIQIIQHNDGSMFSDGPPCLQVLASSGIAEGGRNNALFNVAVYLKHRDENTWREELRKFNKEVIQPSIPEHEVQDLIKSVDRGKAYSYTCAKHPIKQHCNRALCLTREFGISQGADELNVTLSGLTKITTNPPRWLVNIDGTRAELNDTSDLLSEARFERFCVETVHKVLTPINPRKWREIVQELLDKTEVVEAPPEASPEGQLFEYLRRFVEIRGQSETRDALANGRVWLSEGKAFFRSTDFFNYLKREGFRELRSGKIFQLLHDKGLGKDRFNIKGQNVACWTVPIDKMQDQAFDAPKFDDPFGDK